MTFKNNEVKKEWRETFRMFRERSKQKPDGSGTVITSVINLSTGDFAELWANLMEKEIAKRKKVKDIAEITLKKADRIDHIPEGSYPEVVCLLWKAWKYGESLRKWFNDYWVGKIDDSYEEKARRANETPGMVLGHEE